MKARRPGAAVRSSSQYLRLVWANRENKDVLERLKTDQDYVYALLADLEKAEHS